ncbi:hypothetical protein EJB05_26356, partial [Eragrostis curvula]
MADPVGWGIEVAGWIISPIMSRLLNKGFSYLGFHSSDKLKNLEGKVLQLKLMLEAAEASPCSDSMELWMKELKSAFYGAQDILDSIDYSHLQSRILSQTDCKSGVTCYRCSTKQISGIKTNFKVSTGSRRKLKATLDKIENLVDEGHKLLSLLNLPANGDSINNTMRWPTKTTSAAPRVLGRDRDVETIRGMLRDTPADNEPSSSRNRCYSVIGIHGIPGSGKTTLAQYICEKEREDGYYDLIMWIHVSQNFSVDTIFTEMLEIASGGKRDQLCNLDTLQRELEGKLRGKRFFLVLDDVWYDKSVSEQQLDLLVSPLKAGKRGSSVLVTTRTADAARALGADQNLFALPDLDKEQFFSLFMHYALDGATNDEVLLREHVCIGRKIAEKLGRSPLAARTVAGQLNRRLDIDFWRSALNRDLLDGIIGALSWSYQQLDEHIRQCFTYCSMFPRRYKLQRDELVHLWMAQGFVENGNGTRDIEDIGDDYFHVLLSCSFIQLKQDTNGEEYFTIHDLMHDLAERVAGGDCFRIEKGMEARIPRDVRHLFIESYDIEVFEHILKLENLRTLLIMSSSANNLTSQDFERVIKCLKKLRVVRVGLCSLRAIPPCIGELKHLRYLVLWGSLIPLYEITLPSTFTKLYNLQKFSVPVVAQLHCSSFKEMTNLINLRYLQCANFNFPDVGRLMLLRTIFGFTVRMARGYEIQQLEHLDNLHGTLQIRGLENVRRKEDARQAKLAKKIHLSGLELEWLTNFPRSHSTRGNQDDRNSSNNLLLGCVPFCSHGLAQRACEPQDDIFEALLPPPLITSLSIRNYSGSTYPSWLSGEQTTLESLQFLEFTGCTGSDAPTMVSRHLRTVFISSCNWNSLPQNLERLTSLQNLIVVDCKNILSLPILPVSLKKLTLSFCNSALVEICQTRGHPNWQKISHIPVQFIC